GLGVSLGSIVVVSGLTLNGLCSLDGPVVGEDKLAFALLPGRLAVLALAPQLYFVAGDCRDIALVLEGVRDVLGVVGRISAGLVDLGLVVSDRVSQDVAFLLLVSANNDPGMSLAVSQSSGLVVLTGVSTNACTVEAPNGLSQGR